MSYRAESEYGRKVYFGNLGEKFSRPLIAAECLKFGTLQSVWLSHNPAGFAFVVFNHRRDAEDAVKNLNNTLICGRRVRVEMAIAVAREGSRSYYPRTGNDRKRSGPRTPSRSKTRSRSRSRSHSRSSSRSSSRSRSRSYERHRRSRRRNRSRSRSRSYERHRRSRHSK